MSRGEKKDLRPLSHSENKKLKTGDFSIFGDDQSKTTALKGRDVQALASQPQALTTLHAPKPPKMTQKPVLMSCVDEIQPVNLKTESQPQVQRRSTGLCFDDEGMILPHSILGSLDDYRSYLEAKGETELLKRIPKSQSSSEVPGRRQSERCIPSGHRNIQTNALQNWRTRMRQRRQQQDFLSDLLNRPVDNLLMNQNNHFREIQEQKEFLNQAMPLLHSGYGHRVGSEFWSLPQRYGDEMSGIMATLTQTELGKREPVAHIGQPSSIRQESGLIGAETPRPVSRTWDQNEYIQQQCQEVRDVLGNVDFIKPDINRLEVIGSAEPFAFVRVNHSPLMEKEEMEKEHTEKEDNIDPPAQSDDAGSNVLLIPALRFCGQLASWTGNSATKQGEVGISATIFFEALTGELASSHLELHNEGSTAVFYSWHQVPLPSSFPHLRSQTKKPHFYFNSSPGVILPGDTRRVEFIFKSEKAGIMTELWQLNTHPVLLQGATMEVTLRGVALYQDKTADERLFIEMKLEKTVTVKMCQLIVNEVVRGVHTPERPSSPAELYITEEQRFLNENSKLQYLHRPVEDLKRLWHDVSPDSTWNFSVNTLRQAVLSLPAAESAQDTITREKGLAQLNSLLLQLSEPAEHKHHHLTTTAIGQQLWKKLLDTMSDEAMRLKDLLGLPNKEMWIDMKDESQSSDADLTDNINDDEKGEEKEGAAPKEEKFGSKLKLKDDNKGESKSAKTERSVEERKKKGKRRDEVEKHTKEKPEESASLTDIQPESINHQPPDDQNVKPEKTDVYMRLLHKKVYALVEELLDNLCDLMDEEDTLLSTQEAQETH